MGCCSSSEQEYKVAASAHAHAGSGGGSERAQDFSYSELPANSGNAALITNMSAGVISLIEENLALQGPTDAITMRGLLQNQEGLVFSAMETRWCELAGDRFAVARSKDAALAGEYINDDLRVIDLDAWEEGGPAGMTFTTAAGGSAARQTFWVAAPNGVEHSMWQRALAAAVAPGGDAATKLRKELRARAKRKKKDYAKARAKAAAVAADAEAARQAAEAEAWQHEQEENATAAKRQREDRQAEAQRAARRKSAQDANRGAHSLRRRQQRRSTPGSSSLKNPSPLAIKAAEEYAAQAAAEGEGGGMRDRAMVSAPLPDVAAGGGGGGGGGARALARIPLAAGRRRSQGGRWRSCRSPGAQMASCSNGRPATSSRRSTCSRWT
jgi:hypothetical protein